MIHAVGLAVRRWQNSEHTMKGFRKNSVRNRAIKEAFDGGMSVERIAEDYKLSASRVKALISDEMNRGKTSSDPFYKALRRKG